MRMSIVAGVLAMTAVAGCGTSLGRPEGVARRVAASATPAASPSPRPFDRQATAARLKKVLMPAGALVPVGGASAIDKEEFDADYLTSDYCGVGITSIGNSRVMHRRVWENDEMWVANLVHGFGGITGAAIVDASRRNAQTCQTYEFTYSDGLYKYKLLDVVELGQVPGTDDAYGRCKENTGPQGDSWFTCTAHLSRGDLLTEVVVATGGNVANNKAKLLQIVPIAVASLVAA